MRSKKTLQTGVCPSCGVRLVVIQRRDNNTVVRRHDPCGAGRKASSVEPIPLGLGRKES